ncbi:polyprenyl synthetase family protein [Spirochaetia bacterium 38H-sp]|uniref:Polyprenyl synthetase family protein n=1 Tax=Rarispira pelagica TaxID=3141764 RepID=A0ABU9UCU3_9SPIR
MIKEFLSQQRSMIAKKIEDAEECLLKETKHVSAFSDDAVRWLCQFSLRGKMIRGALVILGSSLYAESISDSAYCVAAALELFQSGLLIHDDIMDNDKIRRGDRSLHHRYTMELANVNNSPEKTGESLAICVGDLAFFAAYKLLADAKISPAILAIISTEYAKVGLAQMDDVYYSSTNKEILLEDVLRVYRYKTGRYTFSLPLAVGAMLAEAPQEDIRLLEGIGELLGQAFQVMDDVIGIMGSSDITGKPEGSDIKEGKRTVLWLLLKDRLELSQQEKILSLWGRDISSYQLNKIRKAIEDLGVLDEIKKMISEWNAEILNNLKALSIDTKKKKILEELVKYNTERSF